MTTYTSIYYITKGSVVSVYNSTNTTNSTESGVYTPSSLGNFSYNDDYSWSISCSVNQIGYKNQIYEGEDFKTSTFYNTSDPTVPISWLKYQLIANEKEDESTLGTGIFCNGNYIVNGTTIDVTQLKMYRKTSIYLQYNNFFPIPRVSQTYFTFEYNGIENGTLFYIPDGNYYTASNFVSFEQNNQNLFIAANCGMCSEITNSNIYYNNDVFNETMSAFFAMSAIVLNPV